MTPIPTRLPELDAASREHSMRAARFIAGKIRDAGGWLPFEQWMHLALYAPGLGYYAAGNEKFAAGGTAPSGDFVTAPELSPLFARTLARPVAQVLDACGAAQVLEFGAGSGALAEGLLDALDAMGVAAGYAIVEVAADLRARQRERLGRFGDRVRWLDALPQSFHGCVVGNEVLDAMPARVFRWAEDGLLERGVTVRDGGDGEPVFAWADRPAPEDLRAALAGRMPPLPGYVSEINLQAEAFMRGMGGWLARGAALLIDYGYAQEEYYHPQRAEGTLMCHLRHVAHADPFAAVGVQDITAHVDFTAMVEAAEQGGLEFLGYAPQARFLMNAGLMDLLAAIDPADAASYARAVSPVQRLLSPAEMGELFKVLAVGRDIDVSLAGFAPPSRAGR